MTIKWKPVALAVSCLVMAACLSACTDAQGATQVLADEGYRDIQITGYSPFGCSDDDEVRTSFIALGQDGYRVRGAVCEGLLFKGATVRIFGRVE
jgi:hypothetical protein